MSVRSALAAFSFSGRCDRTKFALAVILGFLFKLQVDRHIAGGSFDLIATKFYTTYAIFAPTVTALNAEAARSLALLLAISIPFCWFGLAIMVRRLRDAGLPVWSALLFFVPIVNAASALALMVWPSRTFATVVPSDPVPRIVRAWMPSGRMGSALVAIVTTSVLGFGTLVLGSQILAEYGWGLFVAAPFTQGALCSIVYGFRERRSLKECVFVAVLSIGIAGLAMLFFAFEGVVCIAMALPLGAAFAAIGAIFGYQISRNAVGARSTASIVVMLVLAAPAVMGAALLHPEVAPVFEVTSTIDVAAPPRLVWKHVIAFPDLAAPTELPFRLGIAYPEGAKIVGRGVGAVRHCRFSTGPFVEPVTIWNEPRLLAFRVAHNPEPMQEWTPFAHVHPPHLDGYMESLHGQFELEPLPGGRTRLTGKTWYRHHLWPATYWSWWSGAIVHQIHLRVLDHVAKLAEADVKK